MPSDSTAVEPASLGGADLCETSYQHGTLTARTTHSTSAWRAGGFASGVVFSYFGVAGAAVVASTSDPVPTLVPPAELGSCFRDGYRTQAKARNRSSAINSAFVGALVLPLALVVRILTR